MNPLSVFKMRTIGPNSSNRESHRQDDVEPGHRTISLLSFLEAENVRLRRAIVELSLGARALREALNRMDGARARRDRRYRPPTDLPRPLSLRKSAKTSQSPLRGAD